MIKSNQSPIRIIAMFKQLFGSLLITLSLMSFAQAGQKQTVGNYDIHYMALDSTFLTPEIARFYDIKRSKYTGLVNITVKNMKTEGHPAVAVQIQGTANNLLDARRTLNFREIREGQSIYYIAEVPFRDDQTINFNIAIRHKKDLNTVLKFKQKFFID